MTSFDEQPRVTVFVPTYNRAGWLAGAIESVLAQTWGRFRLVVSDNASADATPEIVRRFDDPRLSYVRLDHHVELHEHFNLCLERAATEYLFILPDDDRMAPDLLERTVAVLDHNPRAGMAHGQVTVVGETGTVIAERHSLTGLSGDALESGEDFIRQTMSMSHRVYTSAALIRTEALSGIRLDHRDVPITDVGLCLRIALGWDMAFVAHPLATYRVHATAQTAATTDVTEGGCIQTIDGILKSHEVKVRFIEEHSERLRDLGELRRRAARRVRRELIARAAHRSLPDRQLTTTVRALLDVSRLDARILLEPPAWRLLAGSILGHRGVVIFKRVLGRPA